MRNRSIEIGLLPTTTPNKFMECNVFYDEGTPQYFTTGGNSDRGYYLAIKAITQDGPIRSYALFTGGLKGKLAPATRFSQKTLDTVADSALASEAFKRMLPAVLNKQGLALDFEAMNPAIVPAVKAALEGGAA